MLVVHRNCQNDWYFAGNPSDMDRFIRYAVRFKFSQHGVSCSVQRWSKTDTCLDWRKPEQNTLPKSWKTWCCPRLVSSTDSRTSSSWGMRSTATRPKALSSTWSLSCDLLISLVYVFGPWNPWKWELTKAGTGDSPSILESHSLYHLL